LICEDWERGKGKREKGKGKREKGKGKREKGKGLGAFHITLATNAEV